MRRLALGLLLALGACAHEPARKVTPALWEVSGPDGQRGWLFGSIHALPKPVDWRTPAMDSALTGSDRLVMEIGRNDDSQAINRIYRELAASSGLPPLVERVEPEKRAALVASMKRLGLDPADFSQTETWAAALALSRAASADQSRAFGMEQELTEATSAKPVVALEGAEAQLRGFDALPETEQRDLLAAVVAEAGGAIGNERLAHAWASGDMAALEAETRNGILADPELREALLIAPNRRWAKKVAAILRSGGRPLVAVGAAHMAGPAGIPALLASDGFAVKRLQ